MLDKLIKTISLRSRVKDNQDPRLLVKFKNRFMYLNLHTARLIPSIYLDLIKKRDLTKDFSITKDQRLSILIPFRNRENHLKKIIPALRKKLSNQKIIYHIFVIDQADQKPFNRAKLINAGFHLSKDDYDYFCLHDVDLLPIESVYACPSLPLRPTGCIRTSTGERNIANHNLGGVLMLKKEHFLAINGMSNNFWHWGKEDDNMLFRLLSKGINPVIDTKGVFEEIDNSSDRFNVVTDNKVSVDKKAAKQMINLNKKYQNKVARGLTPPCDEGLSDLNYELLERIEEAEDLTRLRVLL